MTSAPATIVYLTRDLVFSSRAGAAGAQTGCRVQVVGNEEAALQRAADPDCRLIILDLGTPGLDVASFVAALPPEKRPPVIAYDSHINEARLQSARDAGCDEVLSRGRFDATLPQILRAAADDAGQNLP
ncbi:MAG: hypothetical protein KY476_19290 [Planctomycetes bacterium]|nr:hypothetical protein [Planctomycetota bacterium]